MRRAGLFATLGLCALAAGCVMFEVAVTNPVAGLTTVAVAPFFNLSEEPTVDGRRFAQAYFAELQKTPGFQVVPIGVVEQAIHDHRLEMTGPEDALKLAEILKVDAVVVGAVTDYSPYYPPRIGMQVAWYSPYDWAFVPGVPLDECAREATMPRRFRIEKASYLQSVWGCSPAEASCQPQVPTAIRGQSPELMAAVPAPAPAVFNPRLPLMAYTRLFDGADPLLTARLRDHVELTGDLRSGGWQAYLQRSEDFIRFTSHLMIVEMLQLHGGEAKRRMVVKLRKYR